VIIIRQPAIAINDRRDNCLANMSINYLVERHFSRETIVEDVVRLARSTRTGRVIDMVICCHGNPGVLYLGEGFNTSQTTLFARWRGLVDRIYIRACNLAEIRQTGQNQGDGNRFCISMARSVACTIIASTELQLTRTSTYAGGLPYGLLDNYEGLVMWYGPQGQVLPQSRRGPSSRNDD
jgi:hypothetical protein